MRHTLACLTLLALFAPAHLFAADDPLKPVDDVPGLPRVLLIGDSISIGYTQPTRQLLKGKANVQRIPANSQHTGVVLANLDKWLGDGRWDVIHFNIGLHDVKRLKQDRQIGPEQYEKNLAQIVDRLKKTGAKLVWASTTPIPDGAAGRQPGDEVEYNKLAAKIMAAAGVPTNDLYAAALKNQEKWQQPKNVHFTPEGSRGLAEKVAEAILAQLPKK